MIHLQTIQTTNHVSPNIHENPKLQINKHKITILSKIRNPNRKFYAYLTQGYQTSRVQPPRELAMALNNLVN